MSEQAASTESKSHKRTPLYDAHVRRGARIVAFAGYEMPVQYGTGILNEHTWTRERAGLFDISHMGQALIASDDGRYETAAAAIEALVPADIVGLAPGQQRYTQFLNDDGGIIDDLMIARPDKPWGDGLLFLVVNASRKSMDYDVIASGLPSAVHLKPQIDRALIALQGPKAAELLRSICPQATKLLFMQAVTAQITGIDCFISRSGYTGEDGFEISVSEHDVEPLWEALLKSGEACPCGLGARDSLRLEAGLCLYGHELDETTSPIEAGLSWSIPKRRREQGGFIGAARIQRDLSIGPTRRRVGILPEGRAPARDGTEIRSQAGVPIGVVTSGGFSPTLKRPIAMGYVSVDHAVGNTPVKLVVRGNELDAHIVTLPFVPHNYRR